MCFWSACPKSVYYLQQIETDSAVLLFTAFLRVTAIVTRKETIKLLFVQAARLSWDKFKSDLHQKAIASSKSPFKQLMQNKKKQMIFLIPQVSVIDTDIYIEFIDCGLL